jgi:hypothetical protein
MESMSILHERMLECLRQRAGIDAVETFTECANLDYQPGDCLIAVGELVNWGLVRVESDRVEITEQGREYLRCEPVRGLG